MNRSGVTFEVRLTSKLPGRAAAKALRRLFILAGVPSPQLVESFSESRAEARVSFFTADASAARALRRELAGRSGKNALLSLVRLKDADWRTKWKKGLKPFRITREIRIVPFHLKGKVRPSGARDIFIDTTMAFGTGLHPTTQATARFIEEKRGRFSDFLDLGTGSGILCLIAAHYGARRLAGYDISADAVATAKRNCALNGLKKARLAAADVLSLEPVRSFGFVAANLLAPVLIAGRERIIASVRPGGYLAVSGVWGKDWGRFRGHFESPALERLAVKRRKGWVSVLYRRRTAEARRRFT